MDQIQKRADEAQKTSGTSQAIKEAFEAEKENKIEITRKVILVYSSCCGCGCSDVDVARTVPFDSPLKSGDRIFDTIKGDEIL